MATRYSGPDTKINIEYRDSRPPRTNAKGEFMPAIGDHYHTTISVRGKHVWTGDVQPPRMLTHGSGLSQGYDSSAAYDEMAESALAFYVHDMEERGERGAGDNLDYNETGYAVRRQKAYR